MKKRTISLAMVVILVLATSMSAFARWSYTKTCTPKLTFAGTTAQCSVDVKANSSTSTINATLRLIRENKDGSETTLATWTAPQATGSLAYGETKSVTSGLYYRLEVTATVKPADGGSETVTDSIRNKCP